MLHAAALNDAGLQENGLKLQGDNGGLRPGLGYLRFGIFPWLLGSWVTTYCPGRMVEHPKSKTTQPGSQSLRPPLSHCTGKNHLASSNITQVFSSVFSHITRCRLVLIRRRGHGARDPAAPAGDPPGGEDEGELGDGEGGGDEGECAGEGLDGGAVEGAEEQQKLKYY